MDVAQVVERFKRIWEEVVVRRARPRACPGCGRGRIWWDGWSVRSASVWLDGSVLHLPEVRCRRARCGDCRHRWQLRPPGLVAHKHYQLGVVAEAVGSYLFDPDATQGGVAARLGCSRRQIGRWIGWVAELARPRDLQARLVELSDRPILPDLPVVATEERKAATPERRVRLRQAAHVLTALEALGSALGLEPPGLGSVLERLGRISTYAAPAIPDFARRLPPGGVATLGA